MRLLWDRSGGTLPGTLGWQGQVRFYCCGIQHLQTDFWGLLVVAFSSSWRRSSLELVCPEKNHRPACWQKNAEGREQARLRLRAEKQTRCQDALGNSLPQHSLSCVGDWPLRSPR